MLQCFSFKSSSATTTPTPTPTRSTSFPTSPPPTINLNNCPPHSQVNSTDETPRSNTQSSPPTITREYTFAVQSNSYKEMLSTIDLPNHQDQIQVHFNNNEEIVQKVLRPNRESIQDAVRLARPNTLTGLVSTCFDKSENTINLCLLLHQSVYHTRTLYHELYKLLDVLPEDLDSCSQPQCNSAFEIFLQFNRIDNPFQYPDSYNFREIRGCLSQLKEQLDHQIYKSQSRVQLVHRVTAGSAICIIGSVVGVVVSAAIIATHAFAAVVASPLCTLVDLPRNFNEKENAHVKQLGDAARGTFVLNNHLGTIDCLVAGLFAAVKDDKQLIRLGLEIGNDKHAVLETLKLLQKNQSNFVACIDKLEEHIILCFKDVNHARSMLFNVINLYQTASS